MNLSLTKLPWYGQIAAFVVLAGGGAGLYYYYYEVPARTEMATRAVQLKALRADVAKGQATERKLPQFRTQVEDLEQRLTDLSEVLPEEKDAADLLRQMQTVAVQSSLVIKSFKPSPVVTRQLHAEWPISLELDGTYHNLAAFFDRLGHFARIVNVTGLTVKGKDKGDGRSTISASCVATTFVLLDKPAPAKKGKGADKGGKAAQKSAKKVA